MASAFTNDKIGRLIITLKCEPAFGSILRGQHNNIAAGYYMNKEHWNSVYLDSDVWLGYSKNDVRENNEAKTRQRCNKRVTQGREQHNGRASVGIRYRDTSYKWRV